MDKWFSVWLGDLEMNPYFLSFEEAVLLARKIAGLKAKNGCSSVIVTNELSCEEVAVFF